MRTSSLALIAAGLVALEGGDALRAAAPVRARLVRSGAPSVARVSALAKPRALPRMEAVPAELCDSDDPEEVCMLPMGLSVPMTMVKTAKLGASFAAWFALNIMYNLTNKKCQNVFPMPWTMTVVSLFVGIPYVLFMWFTGLRKAPKIDAEGWKKIFPIGVFHAAGHASAVIALGAGAVSFAQIVKAGEPVFTCLLSYLVLGQVFHPLVYATLIPIIGGVALASLKELSFSYKALAGAMLSNLAFASRAVYSKAQMDKPVGENLGAANLYGVLTIIAFLLSLPFFLYYELPSLSTAWSAAVAKKGAYWMWRQMFLDGLYYYAYNEVAFFTLSQVNPVTHAIGNTVKRVAIIAATVIVFRNPVSPLSIVGSAIAVAGALGYSLAKTATSKPAAKLA
ncbi:triose-phosphate transporter family-domain-containing protein [Pavlovales sp. CCMP2436]|nr:triose-phosphate transporter family-domain-containing protein [Pavlovales sp. CCMP2436]